VGYYEHLMVRSVAQRRVSNHGRVGTALAHGPSFRLRPSGYGGQVETALHASSGRGGACCALNPSCAPHPCKKTRHQAAVARRTGPMAADLQGSSLLFPVNTGEIQGIYRDGFAAFSICDLMTSFAVAPRRSPRVEIMSPRMRGDAARVMAAIDAPRWPSPGGRHFEHLMVRSVAQRRVSNTQVGCSRLAHRIMPISGKPEIGGSWHSCPRPVLPPSPFGLRRTSRDGALILRLPHPSRRGGGGGAPQDEADRRTRLLRTRLSVSMAGFVVKNNESTRRMPRAGSGGRAVRRPATQQGPRRSLLAFIRDVTA
jgi:hypothetical protein